MQLNIIHIIQVSDIDMFIFKYSFIRFLRVSLVPRHDAENNAGVDILSSLAHSSFDHLLNF